MSDGKISNQGQAIIQARNQGRLLPMVQAKVKAGSFSSHIFPCRIIS